VVTAPRSANAQSAELRWAGHVADTFVRRTSSNLIEAWTVEDGGRIRHRTPSSSTNGAWSFQDVPDEVLDTLHRIFFLPNGTTGWAVGAGGWVLHTTNGGTTWSVQSRIETVLDPLEFVVVDPWEELYDIHFLNAEEGWMISLHSIWSTDDGGDTWDLLDRVIPGGSSMTQNQTYDLHTPYFHLYGLDVVERSDGSRLALIVGQPGIVLKSASDGTDFSLTTWEVMWDVGMLCPSSGGCSSVANVLEGCACEQLCLSAGPIPASEAHSGPWMEIWDVAIGTHATEPLALFVGGVGFQCGMIFGSGDDGETWDKESHECTCPTSPCLDCESLAAYNPDPQDPDHLYRLQYFRMQYGVHLFPDNSAVSVAYNGQQTVRYAATGIWADRSEFGAGLPTVQNSITFPLTGAAGATLSNGTKVAIIGGMGGLLRESFDGGNDWDTIGEPAPHRIADVSFLDDGDGWHVGQFYRISRTDDGAESWIEQEPATEGTNGDYQAVACEPSTDQRAVAVGNPFVIDPGVNNNTLPRIRYTDFTSQPLWSNATIRASSTYETFLNGKALYDATWNGSEFWAVGEGGLVMKSDSGGGSWNLVFPESESAIADFQMEGIAFRGTATALIVGRRSVGGSVQGVVYQYTVGSTPTWTAMTLPSGVQISGLWDVEIGGDTAWVVGEEVVSDEPVGIVLKATYSGGTFGALSEESGPSGGFPRCTTGEAFGDIPVLNAVGVAPVTGQVWVGGACGRLWMRSTSNAWIQVKSQTDAHILGMSFVPLGTTGAAGYLGGFRSGPTQQSIVRVQ
jgi:photosystem II stability/assembly factor-like uncharacterized protein